MEENKDECPGVVLTRRQMLENLTLLQYLYNALGQDKLIDWILKEKKELNKN